MGALIVSTLGSSAAEEVPKAVPSCLAMIGPGPRIDTNVKPYFLSGNFYGDGKCSYAVLISKNQKRGILICNSSQKREEHMGAGLPFNGMVNLNFSTWKL
jgi:hypothetical protein